MDSPPLSELHPDFVAAQRSVGLADDRAKLPTFQSWVLHFARLVASGEVEQTDAVDGLVVIATNNSLYETQRQRDDVEHIIGQGLKGIATLAIAHTKNDTIQAFDIRLRRELGHRLRPMPISEFLALTFPVRQLILAPWLPQKGLVMIYSPRGTGKTLFGMTTAYSIAAGSSFLEFCAPRPRKVLYLDGEMPAQTMQERLAAIGKGFSQQPPSPDYFRILCSDITEGGLPDLATPEGQAEIDAQVHDAEVLIVDNISTLVRRGKENEGEGWLPVQEWALRHRRAGRSIALIHHAGKGGAQRGTSRREDVLDTVIALRRPADYSPDQGARFEVNFEKTRGLYGDEAQPFEARYEVRDGAAVWTRTTITDAELTRVANAIREGMSIREAAVALNLHRSKVDRLKRRATEKGLLDE
jgi:putative DNA primase/helicase